MATAEPAAHAGAEPTLTRGPGGGPERTRRWVWAGLSVVLAGGLGLRLWGIGQGLPYVYNVDEYEHFVPIAVEMFAKGTLDPHYFANPPALTYVLHFLFDLAYGGPHGVERAFALHPGEVFTLARVAVAVLGTLALWLVYLTGARLFNRAVGLLAAAIEAVAFLPVFYGHMALNDAPTLAPLTLSLLGSAGVLRKGRARDYAIAGIGLGLACASKYTAGIVLVPLAVAIAACYLESRPASPRAAGRRALGGSALAGACALAAFLIANPYALLDFHSFHAELVHQQTLSGESQGKLGAPKDGGLAYYLWSFTWGLGWGPSLAALGGALTVWRCQRRLGWLLVPAALLFIAFMSLQGRYFGRWLLPIFPVACLLAACFVVQVIGWCGRALNGSGLRAALTTLFVVALLVQGVVYSVHSGLVLSRADTRNLTRTWMLAHIPAGARIVAEPVELEEWAREVEPGTATVSNPYRWQLYPVLYRRVSASGAIAPDFIKPPVGLENYETTLYPALIDFYEREHYCWVITGSTESGRAFADRGAVPGAIAYYRKLARDGEVVYRASPYGQGQAPVAFGFDWSFDYYPLAYHRPGPVMTIYRLRGGACRR
ncbi:MAG TPA: glycosyltransferase family 39 protein [Solirubrobacteraceae bacterium]|jgi:4-amino-4-deoxy-L-arabinose transferase-like glycosyltransferase|nr:glycosyltransferase family 39 protein [Solirubrobacteraceae bacterium]